MVVNNPMLSIGRVSSVVTYVVALSMAVVVLLFSKQAPAAMTEEQALHFGTFALAHNLTVSTLRVPYSGNNPIATNKLYPLSPGQAGHYRLTAYPAFMPVIVTISDFILRVGASEPLSISDFTHPAIMMDANGEALLKVGATLSTSGSGTNYGDAAYTGTMNITISW